MLINRTLLRFNVGFIVNQAIGYSWDFEFEIPEFIVLDDIVVKNLAGNIVISRTTEGLLVQVKGQAQTEMDCVYCLDSFNQNLHFDFVEIFTFPSHAEKDTELILPDDLHIDLGPLLREYLVLDIPMNPVCKLDCKGLCPICGEKLENDTCNHDDESVDSRLMVLKSLLSDKKPKVE